MYRAFQGGSTSSSRISSMREVQPPRLLVELPPWPEVFFENLADLLLGIFWQKSSRLTSAPAPFWDDVFLPRRLPLGAFRKSGLLHIFFIVVLWAGSRANWLSPAIEERNLFENTRIVYYPLSRYLPAIHEGPDLPRGKIDRMSAPAYAEQRIVSVPRRPDNRSQTIFTPPQLSIGHEMPLPNIVAWTARPAPVPPIPDAVHTDSHPILTLPVPVPPIPTLEPRSKAPEMMPVPVAPPPDVITSAKLQQPALPEPVVVGPPPSADRLRRPGELNLKRLDPAITAPNISAPEQQAMWIKSGPVTTTRSGGSAVAPVLVSGGTTGQAVGQVVVLGLNPTMPSGPIAVPQGNRRGEFAAGPEGKAGAPGTPDIHMPVNENSSGGTGELSPLAGIEVSPGPPAPVHSSASPAFMAALKATRPVDIARLTRPNAEPSPAPPSLEKTVFGAKKYYSMTLSMPNLTSSGGSWVIRFAELAQTSGQGELTAPVATFKVDPAYPPESRRKGTKGVVVLYAVIHADGTVGQVRVLRSLDEQLDASARTALMKWRFRPGTKNGIAIDLEAVVDIPFRTTGE